MRKNYCSRLKTENFSLRSKSKAFTPVKSGKAGRPKAYLTGFTLVELLVVALIITLLAVVVIVGYNSSRTAARDVRRKSDLTSLTSALREYYHIYGYYPAGNYGEATTILANNGYIARTPDDPKNSGNYVYTYYHILKTATAPEYVILHATMEDPSNNVGGYTENGEGGSHCSGSTDYCVKLQY